MSAFVCGDLVRVAGFDDLGRELSGMTGRIETLTPLYANVRLTSWPGEAVRVERETLTLISAREIRPEPVTVVVESARRHVGDGDNGRRSCRWCRLRRFTRSRSTGQGSRHHVA